MVVYNFSLNSHIGCGYNNCPKKKKEKTKIKINF